MAPFVAYALVRQSRSRSVDVMPAIPVGWSSDSVTAAVKESSDGADHLPAKMTVKASPVAKPCCSARSQFHSAGEGRKCRGL